MTILFKAASNKVVEAWQTQFGLTLTKRNDLSQEAAGKRVDLTCRVEDLGRLNQTFDGIADMTSKLWDNETDLLSAEELSLVDFEDIFFPSENGHSLPGRQLRGAYALRISQMHEEAAPASCSPAGMLRKLEKARQ